MIEATYDLSGQSWTVAGDGGEIVVGISDGDADSFKPDDLRFGWTVTMNGEQTDDVSHPPANGKFVEIRSTARFYGRTNALPDDQVTVTFFASEAGAQVEAQHTFTMPRPPQPYPSWTWGDGAWTAPVPYPDDEAPYLWDEDVQDWVPFDPEGV